MKRSVNFTKLLTILLGSGKYFVIDIRDVSDVFDLIPNMPEESYDDIKATMTRMPT